MSNAISPAWNKTSDRFETGNRTNRANNNAPATLRSPLLFKMLDKLEPEQRYNILDIGKASGTSIDSLSDHWCKLFITDAATGIQRFNYQEEDLTNRFSALLNNTILMRESNISDLDIVLLWDLPNYLPSELIKVLTSHLLPLSSPRLVLHTYIYTTRQMPASPANYHITRDTNISMHATSNTQITCPLYHQTELQKYFSPLIVDHSVMLSSGIQEYIFHLA